MNKDELKENIYKRFAPFVAGAMVAADEMGKPDAKPSIIQKGDELVDYIVNLIMVERNAKI